jgi:hypothetical protein
MAKRKRALPPRYSSAGYSVWSIRRTIAEAENVARWNPWLAHAWMEEARDQISLDNPFYTEFDEAVDRINAYWISLYKYRWFRETDFWEKDGFNHPPTYIEPINY